MIKTCLLLSLFAAHFCMATTALDGPGGTGGGGEKPINFKRRALGIYQVLSGQPEKASQVLGFDIGLYLDAVNSTGILCAADDGPVTPLFLRKHGELAFFHKQTNSIYLDCENYQLETENEDINSMTDDFHVLMFHEYMRKLYQITHEGSDYKVSTLLPKALRAADDNGFGDPVAGKPTYVPGGLPVEPGPSRGLGQDQD